jgi:hypothetical protein
MKNEYASSDYASNQGFEMVTRGRGRGRGRFGLKKNFRQTGNNIPTDNGEVNPMDDSEQEIDDNPYYTIKHSFPDTGTHNTFASLTTEELESVPTEEPKSKQEECVDTTEKD